MFKKTLGAVLATVATADINTDFHDVLHGTHLLSEMDLQPLWTQFKTEYAELSPVDLNNDDAMYTFFEKLDSIIEHNSREDKTWSRGLN